MSDFRLDAACRDTDPELFFPVGTGGPALLQIARAKTVCRRCPVLAECREWAVESLPYGVAGGMSEDERFLERTRRTRARSATRERVGAAQ